MDRKELIEKIKSSSVEELLEHPKICVEAVRWNWEALQYVPEAVQMSHPEVCIEAVRKNGRALQYVPEAVQMSHLEICLEAVRKNGRALQYVPEAVQMSHLEICLEAVRENERALAYVPEEIKISHLEMCIEAVRKDGRVLAYVPEEIKISHPEMCIEAVRQDGRALKHVPEEIKISHPEMCIEATREDGEALEYVPEVVQMFHPEICIEAVRKNWYLLYYVPEPVQIHHPEICLEAIRKYWEALEYVPKAVQMSHPEICIEAGRKNVCALKYAPEAVQMSHPEICIEVVRQDGNALEYVPETVQMSHPKICIEAVRQYAGALEYVPEIMQMSHPDMIIQMLKENLQVYKYISPNVRNLEQVQNFMFEDLGRIEKIKEKAMFDKSGNYNEAQMNMFYHQMVKSIGLDEVEKLVQLPNISEEDVQKYRLQYTDKLYELFEQTYTLKGEVGAAADIFRGIDLSSFSSKGKNVKWDIYRSLNSLLEQSEGLNLQELLENSIIKSGQKVPEKLIEKFKGKQKTVLKRLADERIEAIDGRLFLALNEGLEGQQEPIKKMIESKLKESIVEGEGVCSIDSVLQSIESELGRTREDGHNFYSPHILSQKDKILDITRKFLEDKSINGTLSKSLVQILSEKKSQIGQGWIRKLENIPTHLTKDEYLVLQEKLGITLDATYELVAKDRTNEEAYKMLAEAEYPGVLTYEKVEHMFSSMKEPFSTEFRNFYKAHKQEILSNPEVYMDLSRMHNNFDSIISKPEVRSRYERGELTVENLQTILREQKYDNIKDENKRLADVAASSGLDKEYFDAAQKVFDITRQREGSALPQVSVHKRKFRGRMLRADDPLNIFAGNITTCCQRFGDVGEGAMMHAATEKNGAIFVIEQLDENGKVVKPIGQSWTWRNRSRICYDNIEINDFTLKSLSKEDQKEIMDIYIEAGKKAIQNDEKMMTGLLKQGKITQEVYDEVVLKEVTCGVGYNDLDELTERVENGQLKRSESIILPKEADKNYDGYKSNRPWIDSRDTQILLASMEEGKLKEIEERRAKSKKLQEYEVPVEYKNARQVDELKGKEVYSSDVNVIKKIERTVYRDEQQILQNCDVIDDIAEQYGLDTDKLEVLISRDKDWYMIGEEKEHEYYIADLAMVGGVNSQKNQEMDSDSRMATLEIALEVYQKMIDMAKKEKNIRYEATRDTSYLNTTRMSEKGLIEILEDKKSKFSGSDIDMNNVVVKPNIEALEKELEKVKVTLSKLRERGLTKVVNKKSLNDKEEI